MKRSLARELVGVAALLALPSLLLQLALPVPRLDADAVEYYSHLRSLYVDGEQVAEGRLEGTHATIFSADSTASVGEKAGAPISDDFSRTGKHTFNGRVQWVHIKVGDDSHDHYLDDAERYRIAMSLQ